MKRSSILTALFIIGVTALMFIPIGLSSVPNYGGGASNSDNSTSGEFATLTINGGKYDGTFDKTILYVEDYTVGGQATYYPLNDSKKQTLTTVNAKPAVLCGSKTTFTVTPSEGNVLPAYTFEMTLDSGTANGEILVRATINSVETVTTFNRVGGLQWNVPQGISTVQIEIFAVVPSAGVAEIPADPLVDAKFSFRAVIEK